MLILRGQDKPIAALAFGADATKLYVVHEGFAVGTRVWDLASHTSAGFAVKGDRVYGEFTVHPGGKWAFCRHNANGCAVDLTNGRTRPIDISDLWDRITISPNGERIVTIGGALVSPRRWVSRLCGWELSKTGPRQTWQRNASADAIPNQVVFVGNDTLVTADAVPYRSAAKQASFPRRRFTVRSVVSGKPQTTFGGTHLNNRCPQVLGSPDGKHFVARRGLALRVWDASDWKKPPRVIAGKHDRENASPRAAAFHPSRPYFLLANHGPSVLVFDTTTWKLARRWTWRAGNLEAVAVSPDGSLAAAGSSRGTVVVWDLDL